MLDLALAYVDHTLRANRRADGLYHAYNILRLGRRREATVTTLYEMLEGQVAILSSGLLDGDEALALLHTLRAASSTAPTSTATSSTPTASCPAFCARTRSPPQQVAGLALVACLAQRGDRTLLVRDENGVYHFNGAFRNAQDVAAALQQLRPTPRWPRWSKPTTPAILDLFEATFVHHAFTGRSGTFFAYEGLGSIYWHMVSKLLLGRAGKLLVGAYAPAPILPPCRISSPPTTTSAPVSASTNPPASTAPSPPTPTRTPPRARAPSSPA